MSPRESTQRRSWNVSLNLLKQYQKKHGNVDVPPSHVDSKTKFPLGKWLRSILDKPMTDLSSSQARDLTSVGVKWEPTWDEWFDLLVEYQDEHGHVSPAPDEVYKSRTLGDWTASQRTAYSVQKKQTGMKDKGKPAITNEQIARLKEIGFKWRLLSASGRKTSAADSKKKKKAAKPTPKTIAADHSDEPIRTDSRRRAAKPTKKTTTTIKNKAKSTTKATAKGPRAMQKKKREKIVERVVKILSFDEWLEILVAYKKEYNHVSPSNKEVFRNERLGNWVSNQRQAYSRYERGIVGVSSKMSPERIAKLESIGFVWRCRDVAGAAVDQLDKDDENSGVEDDDDDLVEEEATTTNNVSAHTRRTRLTAKRGAKDMGKTKSKAQGQRSKSPKAAQVPAVSSASVPKTTKVAPSPSNKRKCLDGDMYSGKGGKGQNKLQKRASGKDATQADKTGDAVRTKARPTVPLDAPITPAPMSPANESSSIDGTRSESLSTCSNSQITATETPAVCFLNHSRNREVPEEFVQVPTTENQDIQTVDFEHLISPAGGDVCGGEILATLNEPKEAEKLDSDPPFSEDDNRMAAMLVAMRPLVAAEIENPTIDSLKPSTPTKDIEMMTIAGKDPSHVTLDDSSAVPSTPSPDDQPAAETVDATGGWLTSTTWETKLALLERFKMEHGHLSVSPEDVDSETGALIGEWVQTLDKGNMSEGRIASLKSMGFVWPSSQKSSKRKSKKLAAQKMSSWTDWMDLLVQYKDFYGNASPGHGVVFRGKNLGQWASNQRNAFSRQQRGMRGKNSSMPSDRVSKLEAIGFCWKLGKSAGKAMKTPDTYDCRLRSPSDDVEEVDDDQSTTSSVTGTTVGTGTSGKDQLTKTEPPSRGPAPVTPEALPIFVPEANTVNVTDPVTASFVPEISFLQRGTTLDQPGATENANLQQFAASFDRQGMSGVAQPIGVSATNGVRAKLDYGQVLQDMALCAANYPFSLNPNRSAALLALDGDINPPTPGIAGQSIFRVLNLAQAVGDPNPYFGGQQAISPSLF